MRILILHNRYRQAGGEDVAVGVEARLLTEAGCETRVVEVDNDDLNGVLARTGAAAACVYSWPARRRVAGLLRDFPADVVHVHNFFPRWSPSVYDACHAAGVPVVQTLHNYRLVCPAATLCRGGRVCEACVGHRVAWPAVRYGCYRGSRTGSAVVSAMLAMHRLRRTWSRRVTRFVALTEFARRRLLAGGLPPERVCVKPNTMCDPPAAGDGSGGFALFAGRLCIEKGVQPLLAAWSGAHPPRIPLRVVGDGPLREQVRAATRPGGRIEWLGPLPRQRVIELMQRSVCLVVPSLWYEGFPMTVVEAYACGLPVVASRLGSLEEVVAHERTGLLFHPGDAAALAAAVDGLAGRADRLPAMRAAASGDFRTRYAPEVNRDQLLGIYDHVRRELAASGRKHGRVAGP